ncbi:hypothetical protein [Stenotrophomonas geniculata]|uniref:hypothetical protein n=1 Tax=Stenotrophomonas geniculata TaxID=86188 RepID=UPI002ACD4B10|nr:hypothetical protein [Stenotrophomonas geniculata]
MSNKKFEELAQRLAARTEQLRSERPPARPALHLVRGTKAIDPDEILAAGCRGQSAIMVEWHCRMIRNIRRRCGEAGQHIIDQACRGVAGIESLPHEDLIQLHKDMERAEECLREGISFHDAGLLRTHYG